MFQYFIIIHHFIHQWDYRPLMGPTLFFSYAFFFTQTVGLVGRVMSPSQGRYLHTGQHKHRINAHTHPRLEWGSNPRSQRSKTVHALERAATESYTYRRIFLKKVVYINPCSEIYGGFPKYNSAHNFTHLVLL
jgi:hypothetical protein